MLEIIDRLKRKRSLQLLTIYVRYLIGAIFIFGSIGLLKFGETGLLNSSILTPSYNSSFSFLHVLKTVFESGLYWQFFGGMQLIAGFFLLTQKYAKIGALFFFLMMINITLLSYVFQLTNTTFVIIFILLATLYLLVWDFRFYRGLFLSKKLELREDLTVANHNFWVLLGFIMILSVFVLSALGISLFANLLFFVAEAILGYFTFYFLNRNNLLQTQKVYSEM